MNQSVCEIPWYIARDAIVLPLGAGGMVYLEGTIKTKIMDVLLFLAPAELILVTRVAVLAVLHHQLLGTAQRLQVWKDPLPR